MSEADLLKRIRRLAGPRVPGLVRGIGDDCAIVHQPGARDDLLITTDFLIEDVHFRASTHPAEAVGHKALARGLSDIAAMGGAPRYCLLSLALPAAAARHWIDRFYRGLLRLAGRTGTALIGGDLARADRVICDIVVIGAVPAGTALRRDTARPDDGIYVSGQLGRPWKSHLRPEPRLALGRFLRTRLRASAAMDLTDSLALDLHRLCLESGVSAALDREPPRWRGASADAALHGGEDYELLFTMRPGARVPAEHDGMTLTRIGTIRRGRAGVVEYLGAALEPRGWDHFTNS